MGSKVAEIKPKIKVDVLERVLLLNTVLPKEGSVTNLRLLRQAREALSFSEAENKALKFRTTGEGASQMLQWDPRGVPAKAIFFGEVIEGIIKKALTEMDKRELLTNDHLSLYEKFVEGKTK